MVFKYKNVFVACKCFYLAKLRKYRLLYPLMTFTFWVDPQSLYDRLIKSKCSTKPERYWVKKKDYELISEADDLYKQGQYMEVYEILNRIRFNSNPEVQWRICRVLFQMSADEAAFDEDVRKEMISEAYSLINLAVSLETNNANIYKWMAIITDVKCGQDGLIYKIRAFGVVKAYMEKALELNPNDMIVLYMLGKWCYEMSRLTWFQRLIAGAIYDSPPKSTYKEAYGYLARAAELQKNDYYIPTLYVLGKTCIKLKQFFRARYYLHTASALTPRTEYEEKCIKKCSRNVVIAETRITLTSSAAAKTNMSLASVHPVELHSSHSSLTTLSHSLDDITGCSWSPQVHSEHVMTIEELRNQMTSCFTCGVSWNDHHVSLDCSECGGYALERPCPTCEGACGSIWKRDLTMSHACSKARWQGECNHYPQPNKDQQPSTTLVAQELCSRLEKLSANS